MDASFFVQVAVSVIGGLILAACFGLIKIFGLVKNTATESRSTSKALKKHMKREELNGDKQDDRLAHLEKGHDELCDQIDNFKTDVTKKLDDLFRALPKRRDDMSDDY